MPVCDPSACRIKVKIGWIRQSRSVTLEHIIPLPPY